MAKRIMAMMLALAMVLSLAPTVVLADGEQEVTRSPKAGSHTVAGHSDECSAHCGNGVSWTAWDGDVTKLAAGGHYYLTADTTLTKDVEVAADLHLCLNGYVLTAATNKRVLTTKGDTAVEVVISDCTAYTQDGKLYAGAITGGIDTSTNTGGGAMFVRRGGQVHLYKIRLLKNTSKANGGVATLQAADSNLAGGKLFATGCEVANNSAISGTSLKEGGAFRMAAGTELRLTNTVLSDNSGSNGGVIRAVGGAVTIDGCTFTGNSGAKGGVFYTTGDATLEISNSTFTDNSATTAGAVMYMGGKTVKIQGQTRITGNECNHKTAGGAVYMGSTSCKLILSGEVYIAENTTPYTEDVVLYYADNDTIYVNGLADGSYVEFSTPATAAPQAKDLVVVEGSQSTWKTGWLAYRDANKDLKYIGRDATGFIFQDNLPAVHTHCVCGVENCTAHRQVTYEAWDGDASKLAAGGKYFLTDDAQLTGQVTVKADLDLCLNGKTLTAASGKRHFSTPENGNVTITISDCEAQVKNGVYEAGKLTGADSAYDGGVIYLHKTNKLYMYDGILSDNTAAKAGGAIFVNTDAECYLYGGVIEENEATGNGGAISTSAGSVLTLKDVTIRNNNTQRYGGAVYVNSTADLTISGNTVISGNTRKTVANNLHLTGQSLIKPVNLGDNASVGVYGGEERAISPDTTDVASKFFSDNSAYKVAYREGKLQLVPAVEHIHCQCGKTNCTNSTHKQISYKAWDGDASKLAAGGKYFLTADAQLTGQVTVAADLDLCLHGKTLTAASGKRHFSTPENGNVTITIADCTAQVKDGVYQAGKLTGADSVYDGGAIYLHKTNKLYMYDGILSDNTAEKSGGAIFVDSNAECHLYGGVIENNAAVGNSGAINTSAGSVLTLKDVSIRNNSTQRYGGAVYVNNTAVLTVSGDTVILGNTSKGVTNNLHLAGQSLIRPENLSQNAKIGVNAAAFRTISTETKDYAANFLSDNTKLKIVYQDKVLRTDAAADHRHCLCAGSSTVGCDHTATTYIEWDDPTKLPGTGNYFLSVDVVVTSQTRVENGTLNLCLNGHTVKVGEKGGRIFYLDESGTLNISDCAGSGKLTGATRAAILANAKSANMQINLYGGSITGNTNVTSGAGIVAQGGCSVNMYGGRITGNSLTASLILDANGKPELDEAGNQTCNAANGTALYVAAGNVFNMYGGEISGNTAKEVNYVKADGSTSYAGGSGGAMYIRGIANLYGGKITGNTAKLGGGVMVYGKGAELNLLGTEITGNSASSGGGVISQGSSVINMKSGKVNNNTATGTGAGVYVSTGTTLNMTGGSISGNVAANQENQKNGAGIYMLASTANLTGGIISENKGANGAGVYMSPSGTRYPTLNLGGDVVITGNVAAAAGGAISVTGENATITMTGGTISKNTAKNGGGVITQTKSSFTMSGGSITGNNSTGTGGGVYVSTGTTFTMTGGSIDGNKAAGDGGGICLLRSTGVFKGGTVSNNTAINHAGIRVNGANVTIHNLKLVGNRAVGKPGEDGKNTGGNAGGLFAGQTTYTTNGVKNIAIPKVTIHNIYAANNFANNAGGAMLIQSKGTTFTMTGGTFANNTANGSGGALYLSTNVAVRISGGSFHGNSAKAAGAINFLGCQAEISNVKFYENTVKSQGGVCVIGRDTGNVTMKNVEMYDNTSTGAAGALLLQNYAKLQMENSKFSGNQCETSGGAIYFGNPCYATFKSVEFTENRSVGIGGAIHVHANADVTMDDVTVSDNTAEGGYGGGISTRGRLVLSNSKILNNKCLAGEGGGIGTFRANSQYLADDNGVFATNVIISGNESSLQGGGVYGHRGGPVYLENCTITDNTAKGEGGGVYSDGRFSLIDSTVTGNTSGGEGYAVYLTAAEYDGHSYLTGFKKVGGNVIVRDNNGGDMYIGEGTGVAVVGEAIGEKAHIEIKLHSGVLSEHLFGVYGYEGGDLVYTVTAGDRSVTDPEAYQYYQEPADQDADAAGNIGNVVLYIVVGVVAAAVIAALVLVVMKKKKAGTPAEKANKE